MTKKLEKVEQERLREQERLDSAKSQAKRNELGQFATPPTLAGQIAASALQYLPDQAGLRFLDPSVGTGAFFAALKREAEHHKFKWAVGVEVDSEVVRAARRLWSGFNLEVEEGSFLALLPPKEKAHRANLVLANPPYVRHHHIDPSEKQSLKKRAEELLGSSVSGLAGLYVHFVLQAHLWLDDGAVCAWLLPSEWMDVNYGAALRSYFTKKVTLLRVHRFEAADTQFTDALVSSSVVFFRNTVPASAATCAFTSGPSLAQPTQTWSVSLSHLGSADKWGQLFAGRPRTSTKNVAKGPAMVLGDFMSVRRGIATGANGFFIRPKAEFERLGIDGKFLRPVLPPSRELKTSTIARRKDGYPDIEVPLALLDCALPEAEVKARHPQLWAYLSSPEGQEARQGYLTRNRMPWYSQEQRPRSPFVVTYMGRGTTKKSPFRIFWNQSDATATNVYLLLLPKPAFEKVLSESPDAGRKVLSFLESRTPQELVGLGRVYGGGLHKLEPKELGRLDISELVSELGMDSETKAQQTLAL
jgi:hypothetical protein